MVHKQPMEKNGKFAKARNTIQSVALLFAVAVSIFTIRNEIYKLKPPEIRIRFALTRSTSLLIAVESLSAVINDNKSLPMGLTATNLGELTAKECILRLIHPKNLSIRSDTIELNQKEIYVGALTKTMTTINLPIIHPGQTVHFDRDLTVSYDKTGRNSKVVTKIQQEYNRKASARVPHSKLEATDKGNTGLMSLSIGQKQVNKGSKLMFLPIGQKQVNTGSKLMFQVIGPKQVDEKSILTYEIEARVSAEDLREETTSLYITIGNLEQLQKERGPIIQVKDGKLFRLMR